MRNRLTMEKLARELQLSRLTVSAVVNGRAHQRRISSKTILRVQRHLEKRGYVPLRSAIHLKSRQSTMVGILFCGNLHSHLLDAFNLMLNKFIPTPDGVELLVVQRNQLLDGLRELIARGITHLVWIHSEIPEIEFKEEKRLLPLLSNINTIIYNYAFENQAVERRLKSNRIHLIGIDRTDAFAQLATTLQNLGHKNILFPELLAHWKEHSGQKSIVELFQSRGFNPILTPFLLQSPRQDLFKRGLEIATQITGFLNQHPITAAVMFDDEQAAFVIHHLISMGIRIPEQLSVTGLDGMVLGEVLRVPLTTLRIPTQKMVECTWGLISKPSNTFIHRFSANLVLRSSLGSTSFHA